MRDGGIEANLICSNGDVYTCNVIVEFEIISPHKEPQHHNLLQAAEKVLHKQTSRRICAEPGCTNTARKQRRSWRKYCQTHRHYVWSDPAIKNKPKAKRE